MKKLVCLLMALVMATAVLGGCGTPTAENGQGQSESGKEKVTVALWGTQLLENYAQYLCDEFPEVEFEFTLATNSTDYYRYRNDRDDLPDILTVRRFSLKDAVLIKDLLYDLCDTELASTFYGTYLDNYTYDDGTINWLPACADVDSIIINETLFEEYDVPIPTDYDSFIAACEAFEKVGIQGLPPISVRITPAWKCCRASVPLSSWPWKAGNGARNTRAALQTSCRKKCGCPSLRSSSI